MGRMHSDMGRMHSECEKEKSAQDVHVTGSKVGGRCGVKVLECRLCLPVLSLP